MSKFKYPQRAALASAALLFFSGCAQSQAPIIDASQGARESGANRGVSTSPAAPMPRNNAGVEMLLNQVQTLQEELMQLRGVVEEQGYQIETLKQQSLERYIDLDRRIGGEAASPGQVPVAEAQTAQQPTPAEPEANPQAPVTTAPAASVPAIEPQQTATQAAVAVTPSTEMDAYRDAYGRVKAQDFVGAVGAFEAFLKEFPDSSLVPNAHYWLGELHLQSPQNLDKAQASFQRVLKEFPNHDKAPDALFKLGRIEFMRGNLPQAQTLMQQVIDEYGASGSMAPQLAKQFLDQNFR